MRCRGESWPRTLCRASFRSVCNKSKQRVKCSRCSVSSRTHRRHARRDGRRERQMWHREGLVPKSIPWLNQHMIHRWTTTTATTMTLTPTATTSSLNLGTWFQWRATSLKPWVISSRACPTSGMAARRVAGRYDCAGRASSQLPSLCTAVVVALPACYRPDPRPTCLVVVLQTWLQSVSLPHRDAVKCRACGNGMQLLLQVYAPVDADVVHHDDAYHRELYVFVCKKGGCVGNGGYVPQSCHCAVRSPRHFAPRRQHCYASWRCCSWRRRATVLRAQASRATVDASDGVAGRAASVCAVCGLPAVDRCGRCRAASYCGRFHQALHWNSGHKALCGCVVVSALLWLCVSVLVCAFIIPPSLLARLVAGHLVVCIERRAGRGVAAVMTPRCLSLSLPSWTSFSPSSTWSTTPSPALLSARGLWRTA